MWRNADGVGVGRRMIDGGSCHARTWQPKTNEASTLDRARVRSGSLHAVAYGVLPHCHDLDEYWMVYN